MTARTLDVLNLGAGVQSTTVYLLAREGRLHLDAAVFADVQEEPAAVYAHLEWLKGLGDPPILVRTIGRLGDQLIAGTNGAGSRKKHKPGRDGTTRFVSIPAFTAPDHGGREGKQLTGCETGIIRRQCTKEYKVEVVERAIRYDLLGLKPRQRVPKGVQVRQYFGISADEKGRAKRIEANHAGRAWTVHFPLVEMGWRRGDCEDYLKSRVPHETPRSACVFCPFRSAAEWLSLKQTDPAGFARAVEIDRALRPQGTVANHGFHQSIYLHRKCLPLEVIDLEAEARKEAAKKGPDMFRLMCDEGMCGV